MPMLQVHGLHFNQKDLYRTNEEGGLGIKFPVVAPGVGGGGEGGGRRGGGKGGEQKSCILNKL